MEPVTTDESKSEPEVRIYIETEGTTVTPEMRDTIEGIALMGKELILMMIQNPRALRHLQIVQQQMALRYDELLLLYSQDRHK
jgi:hypothetical protein